MRVGQAAGRTDAGRRRRLNEDAFVCRPPLFAVADGMGGAQAGELASRLAAASLGRSERDAGDGERRVVSLIQAANQAVYERAETDSAATGMGTTLTVALVEGGDAWIGHVGDSRAYLLRGGRVEQLTDDHSLVAELVREGRLTPDEALDHPHRSVITRALGTDAEVEVDAFPVPLEAGDVFLLCSDGLPSMVSDDTILELVERHRSDLDAAAQALVTAANAAGGEDNITAVLFEVVDGVPEEETRELASAGDEDTLHGVPSPFAEAPPRHPAPRRPGISRSALAVAAAALVLLGGIAVVGLSRSHFVGAEPDGRVAVYQGLPWELGFGVRLYRVVSVSRLHAANLSQEERRQLFDHDLVSRNAAEARVRAYGRGVVP